MTELVRCICAVFMCGVQHSSYIGYVSTLSSVVARLFLMRTSTLFDVEIAQRKLIQDTVRLLAVLMRATQTRI